MHIRSPILHPVPIAELRPTQMTVGMREVAAKRKHWRDQAGNKGEKFLAGHTVPAIRGPKKRFFIIDHHHLSRALAEEGQDEIYVTMVADLSKLDPDQFWVYLDNRGFLHPFDEKGRRRDYDDIPKTVMEMVDDPYRSLAGELRRLGGYAKDATPFSEFLWADALRRVVKRKLVEEEFHKAVKEAVRYAKAADADFLPGWCGPVVGD